MQIYLFANKAQDQEALTAATVQFMGVFKSDKRVSFCSDANYIPLMHAVFPHDMG